ncbi:MAG: MFS transporter [Chloroflexi bacterium]|nr:MFS transporter [Chloroflexota bacterium]
MAVGEDAEVAATLGIRRTSPRRLTLGLVLTMSCAALEAISVATAMPATVRDLGGLSLYGWAFSAFMLANLVGITVAGAEADRQGPAGPFAVGVALFTLGLLIAGLAPVMLVLVVGRTVQGLGAGIIGSLSYVAIGRGYTEAEKPRMLAVLSSAWVVPGLIGPALAGMVTASAGWRWVFLGIAPLPPLAALLAFPGLRRLGPGAGVEGSWKRGVVAVCLAAGAGLVLSGLDVQPWPLAASFVLAGCVVALPTLWRLLPAGTLRLASGLPASIAVAAFLNLAFFGVDAFVPLMLTSIRGQSVATAGIPLTGATVGWTAGSWLQARLAPRQSRRLLVESGLVLIGAGTAGTVSVLLSLTPVWLATVSWGIGGLGMGLGFTTVSLLVLESARVGEEGVAATGLQISNVLGGALGTGLGGVIIAQAGRLAVPELVALLAQFLLMLIALGLTALAAVRMERPGAESATSP